MEILGVKIDNLSKTEILKKAEGFLCEDKFHMVSAVNPELVLQAQKDEEFKNILNHADLKIADGTGIWFAFLWHLRFLKCKMAGIELMLEILKLAEKNDLPVFLVNYAGALSGWKETRDAILRNHPGLKIGGIDLDTKFSNEFHATSSIVFCNFGAPYQEKFLNSVKNDKIRLAMGVGGSFDFLTGKRKRAPKVVQKIGLEWLWRFVQEPKYRAKRIWNAVIIFPIKVLINK